MLPPETNTEHGTRKASLNKELVSKLVTKVGTRNTEHGSGTYGPPYVLALQTTLPNQIGMVVSDFIYGEEFTVMFHYLVYQSCSVLPYSYNFYSTGAHLRTF